MGRVVEFDAIRGLAAVAIMLLHLRRLPENPWTYSAVDLFFVLSGYLVTANALKYRGADNFLRVFLARRALRIWPAYFLALAACLILNQCLSWDRPPTAWPFYLTFTQGVHDYVGLASPPFSGMFLHTWTLAIEEQFYTLWPLLLLAGGRRWFGLIVVGCLAVPPWFRGAGFAPYLLLSRGDGLFWGAFLAVLLEDRDRVARHARGFRRFFAATAAGALVGPPLLALWFDGVPTVGPFPARSNVGDPLFTTRACLIDFGLAGLILCAPGHPAFRFLRDRRLVHLGVLSYGLYLYHPLVYATFPGIYRQFVVQGLGLRSRRLMDASTLAVCFGLAELSRRRLERPIEAWKDRLIYRYVNRSGVDTADRPYRGPHRRPVPVSVPADSL